MPMLVHDFMRKAVIRHGDRPALVDSRGTLSYNELWERSARLAGGLRSHGIAKGDRVVAVMHNRNEWVETDLAVSMIGGIRGRLNARDGEREWTVTLEDLTPKVVVAGPEFVDTLERIRSASPNVGDFSLLVLGTGSSYEELIDASKPTDPVPVDEDDIYLVFHTSGTTGRYKGAVYLHRNWFNTYRNIMALFMGGLDHTDALLHVGPLSHQSGILTAPALYQGARSVMMEHFDPESFFEIVERERISCTILAPAIINMLATHPSAAAANLSSLKVIYYSGAPISPTALSKAMEVFGPIFLQGYGSTEGGTVYNTILYPDEHVRALEHNPERLSSCGRPVPFFDVRLVDDDGHEVPVGEMGEIWVRGDAASVRYWNQPEATAQAYEDGWFKMGDLAIRDPEGYITIVDRKNDMIVSGGLNVYPREVEDAIASHPAVREVAVIGVPDEKWGEGVMACIAPVAGATPTLDEIQQHCRDVGLASYKKPIRLELVDEVPKTAVGKLFRRALREKHWAGESRRVG
ncbi:AMP-binding protein [Acidiferrimicrobium sp. IK]|uniref:class I adenylate-forming enzyme family protein n=1 Tax=Acidiferrimicrobium sp. IK TaxID=2871700 RepID=UPI0021CB9012|nr:AMP-binding protein [Acidiferrimicrobium sp. IK]MCU4185930.1 AMP-binding protein [Acidiferrimicrobium sp. IK]